MQPSRTIRYYKLKFLRLKGDPGSLARGIALGTFIGITPTIPLHTALIILFSILLRGNVVAGILASWIVSNPLTFVLQYFLSWKIGNLVTPYDVSWERIKSVMSILTSDIGFMESLYAVAELGLETILALIVGGTLLAIPFTLASYFYSRHFFSQRQKKRQKKSLPPKRQQ